ncbi:hypothetical protein EBR78_05150 [bacterium]|nr:hypothetical protein [bacterium]NBX83606.1 hypothetical protein [bacterium]
MKIPHIILAGFCLLTALGFGATEKLETERGKFEIEVSNDWKVVKDLYGIPFTFLGPKNGPRRAVVLVTPTGTQDLEFNEQALSKNDRSYREGRERWLKSRSGKALRFFPYQKETWAPNLEAHHLGFEYQLGDQKFSENSYYVVCDKKIFHLKSLVPTELGVSEQQTTENTIKSFRCTNS